MAQSPRRPAELVEREFEANLRRAYSDPWWRNLIEFLEMRRDQCVAELVSTLKDQREEDRLRGQINELNFIIAFDAAARNAERKAQGRDESGDQPAPSF